MSRHVNLYEAKTRLSQPVERVARVEEIVIAEAGKPMAKLVPYRPAGARRAGENLLGITFIGEDFDDPMREIEVAFAFRPDAGAQAAIEGMVLGTQDPQLASYGIALLGLGAGP